jgi:hypothetical protein
VSSAVLEIVAKLVPSNYFFPFKIRPLINNFGDSASIVAVARSIFPVPRQALFDFERYEFPVMGLDRITDRLLVYTMRYKRFAEVEYIIATTEYATLTLDACPYNYLIALFDCLTSSTMNRGYDFMDVLDRQIGGPSVRIGTLCDAVCKFIIPSDEYPLSKRLRAECLALRDQNIYQSFYDIPKLLPFRNPACRRCDVCAVFNSTHRI